MEQWSAEESELQQRYGLDAAQLRWRRWCIAANCGGDEDIFAEEYPASAAEAFLVSGRPVFSQRALSAAYAAAPPALRGEIIEQAGKLRFAAEKQGRLYLYQLPRDGAEYVIGVDVAAGLRHGDYSVMWVLERYGLECAAVWHGHIDPDLLAEEAVRLARFYQRALLAPEANNHGAALLYALQRLHYNRVWRRGAEPGFLTTAKSKPEIIAGLAAFIRAGAERIRDRGTLAECLAYLYDDAGHTNAPPGQHDDRVMALAIALYVAEAGALGPRSAEPDWRQEYEVNENTGY